MLPNDGFVRLPSMSEKITAFRMDCVGIATDQKMPRHYQERMGEEEVVSWHLFLNRVASSCANIYHSSGKPHPPLLSVVTTIRLHSLPLASLELGNTEKLN